MSCRSLLLLALLSAGCGSPTEVEFGAPRKVSREQRPTTWDAPTRDRLGIRDMAKSSPHEEPQQRWIGSTPSGWEELPPQPRRFRDLFWRVAGNQETECYLSAGMGGGVAGNMKRWYTEQNGIQDVPSMESLPVVEMAGRQGRLIELNSSGKGMMIAFFAEGPQLTTLKFTGPEAIVKQNREPFLALAKSLRREPGPAPAPGPGPAETQTSSPHGAPDPGGSNPEITATAPPGWTVKKSHRLLHYTFGKDGEVYMSQLGGTLRPTLDIWRGELGLPAMSDSEFQDLPKVRMLGGDGTLLDASGNFQSMSGKQIPGARVLIGALVEGGSITFVKLVGNAAEVEPQREGMLQFLASLRRTP